MRGNAYNSVGNQAAASTVGDNLNTPYKMAGLKFVYMEPTTPFAALSFGEGMTKFIAFDNTGNLGLATVGIANKAFGLSVDYALGKVWDSSELTTPNKKTTRDERNVSAGDQVGVKFAMPMGPVDLAIRGTWETYQYETNYTEEIKTEDGKTKEEVDNDFWDISANLTISNTPSGKKVFWGAGAGFARHENYSKAKFTDSEDSDNNYKKEVTGNDAFIMAQPFFNIGGAVLEAQNARVLLGLNTRVPLVFFDEIKEKAAFEGDNVNKDNYFTMGVYTQPNILAELGLGNCWMVFGGAGFEWKAFGLQSDEYINDYANSDSKTKQEKTIISMATGKTTVQAGARFQYKNFALEASIADGFYNDPLTGFNGGDMIANLGGFINF